MDTQLSIGRFVADAPPGDERRVAQLAELVVRRDLAQALDAADVPAGIWCLRRLNVQVTVHGDDTDATLRGVWAGALVSRLIEALSGADPGVVHYDGPVQAVADLIASTSLGRLERAWAWDKAGIRQRGDPDPASAPGEAIVASLRQLSRHSPGAALAALLQAVARAGPAALHQVLGGSRSRALCGGWPAVAALVAPIPGMPGDLPPARPATAPQDTAVTSGHRESAPNVDGQDLAAAPPDHPSPHAPRTQRLLAADLFCRSALARALGSSRLRPDGTDALAWAALVVAETDPAALGRPTADQLLRAVARLGGSSLPSPRADTSYDITTTPQASALLSRASSRTASGPRPETAELPTAEVDLAHHTPSPTAPGEISTGTTPDPAPQGVPTQWAGLLFLLSLAPAVGLPHTVLADADLARRPLPWVLQTVAVTLLPLPDDDPAVAAFSGLDPAKSSLWRSTAPATADELRAIRRIGERWSQAVARALGRSAGEGTATVRALAARRGTVFFSPGWIDLVLALDEVDVDVRVAGLDLDPGWVPWLGCVLRYCYA
ncbi:hypothetical protein [Streptomyces phaeochromogenes]|uniref:hypothetical protein n=1 Tax=Streptomyces phaeochromogenes TaxID=1923 RepID=UPI002E120E05|nr:hypothetical protein OG437_40935 [Streptomyces phaeochromogenes]